MSVTGVKALTFKTAFFPRPTEYGQNQTTNRPTSSWRGPLFCNNLSVNVARENRSRRARV